MGLHQGIRCLFLLEQHLNVIQVVLTPPGYAKDVRTVLYDYPAVD